MHTVKVCIREKCACGRTRRKKILFIRSYLCIQLFIYLFVKICNFVPFIVCQLGEVEGAINMI